jgi:hypothetical protein
MFEHTTINVHFTRSLYSKLDPTTSNVRVCLPSANTTTTCTEHLLDQEVELDDLETIESPAFRSLKWILENGASLLFDRFVLPPLTAFSLTLSPPFNSPLPLGAHQTSVRRTCSA